MLEYLNEDYHICQFMCVPIGDTAYPPALFTAKEVCIDGVIQATLFCAQRQLYFVMFIHDDITEFCRSLVFSGTVHWFVGRQAFIHYCGLHQVVDESLSSYKPMYCYREYQASTRLIQQYEKSTLNNRI